MSQTTDPNATFLMVDGLPDDVVATIEARDRFFAATSPSDGNAPRFVVDDLRKWTPGQTLRVAFLGGDTQLHRDIEQATKQITAACNIKLDFGFNARTGKYRTWSTRNRRYQAQIRVSFDQQGFFSLVGRDSVTATIGSLLGPVGGRPNQRSLNLGGFHIQRPANWAGVVRHEFLHALAFHHEHQSPEGVCEQEFRWEDDPGYRPTTNAQGAFINDAQGRRPGIYTYLGGPPNNWSRAKVDFNLRRIQPTGVTTGPFDPKSVMLYRFPALFYKSNPSPCAPSGDGETLSEGDKKGLQTIYPANANAAGFVASGQRDALRQVLQVPDLPEELRSSLQMQLKSIG